MNTPMTATHVFYSELGNCIIDTCTDSIPPRSHITHETLEEIRRRYPDAQYMEFETASQAQEDRHKRPVIEITKEKYWEMLEVLPPMGWVQRGGCESFKMSEMHSGIITDIYAKIGDRYFSLRDSQFTKHDEIIKRCEQYKAEH
jgi:hypothetical protein